MKRKLCPHCGAPSSYPVEIGLEHERIIWKPWRGCPADYRHVTPRVITNVLGADQALLPHDTLSCLAETRGAPSANPRDAVSQFLCEQERVDGLFAKVGLRLAHGEHQLHSGLAMEAFELDEAKDEALSNPNFNLIRGGGMHFHFSCHRAPEILRTERVIKKAVERLDVDMKPWITGRSNYRVPGQWEIKPHGFEYRSCIWEGDLKVLRQMTLKAHSVVRGVVDEEFA